MQEEGALAWGSRMPYDSAEEDGFLGRAVFTEYSDVLLRLYVVEDKSKLMRPKAPRVGDKWETSGRQA